MTHLSSLHCYPIKSARGHELERVRVTPLGLADDRRFMVSDPTGRFLSQREHRAWPCWYQSSRAIIFR